MKKNIIFLVALSLISLMQYSKADISVDKMILDFMPKDPAQKNLVVYNHDKNTAYVGTKIYEVQKPGMKDEKRVEIGNSEKDRLVVAPTKLTIPSLARKRLQVINTNENLTQDKIYRVTVVPQIAGFDNPSGGIALKILVGYEVLVIIRPKQINFDLEVTKDKDSITFTNKGNTNILLENVKQCSSDNKCTTILANRLYANNKLTAKLIYPDRPVIADMYYANEFKKVTY